MSKLPTVLQTIDNISEWSGRVVSFFILLSAALILLEIVLRVIFNTATLWSWEMSLFVYGTFTIIGGAYTLLHRGHVKVDILYSRFSQRRRAILDIATFIFVFFFLGVMVWKGWEMTYIAIQAGERTDSTWGPILWPIRIMIPIGALLFLAQALAKFVRDINTVIGRRSLES